MTKKRTIKTPYGKPSVPIEQIRETIRLVVAKRKHKAKLEDTILDLTGRLELTENEVWQLHEVEEELEKLQKEEGVEK